MYKNYVFDLYGTLIDIHTDEESSTLWDKLSLFYTFKGAKYTSEELKSSYSTVVKSMLDSCTNTKYPDVQLELAFYKLYKDKGIEASNDLLMDTAQMFRILSIEYLKLYDGVIELLETLKSKGKKIYLLSNAQRIFTLYEMKTLGIEKYFDDIFFSSDYGICKPDSNFYKSLIKKHNLDIKESIMIGNDPNSDIAGAISVGMDSFYIHSNQSPKIDEQNIKSTYKIMKMDIKKISELTIK